MLINIDHRQKTTPLLTMTAGTCCIQFKFWLKEQWDYLFIPIFPLRHAQTRYDSNEVPHLSKCRVYKTSIHLEGVVAVWHVETDSDVFTAVKDVYKSWSMVMVWNRDWHGKNASESYRGLHKTYDKNVLLTGRLHDSQSV